MTTIFIAIAAVIFFAGVARVVFTRKSDAGTIPAGGTPEGPTTPEPQQPQ